MTFGSVSAVAPAVRLRPIAILDDDADFREALAGGIVALGHSAAHFGEQDAFLAWLPGADPRCLLLDFHLSGSNGLQVQAELATAAPDLPVVFVSACLDEQVSRMALANGALAFLNKPVRLAVIEALLVGL